MAVKAESGSKVAGISDQAVESATGKTWEQWCRILDKGGAKSMAHKEIAKLLSEEHGVGMWWSQMVTVGYEQARGLRSENQSCRGDFQAGVSRTIGVPVATLFAAWKDAKSRSAWLGKRPLVVRKATANKSMRITWPDETSVEVNFYAKASDKSQVTVQHSKLDKKSEVAKAKKTWGDALDQLKAKLENGAPATKRA